MADIIPSIIQQMYYAGQLLQLDDFNREQDYNIRYRNFGNQQLFSAGVLSGLTVHTSGSAISVSSGAAIDINGAYILLTAEKSYVITSADGEYQFTISHQTVPVSGTDNQLKSDPELKLIAAGESINNGILLANVTITNKIVSKIEGAALAVQIRPSRIPQQSIQNLDASVITKGIFDTNRIPDLQNLNGKLTPSQLPPDIIGNKHYLTFFVDQTVVGEGSKIQFSWNTTEDVDSISLSFFSEHGISNLNSGDNAIKLIEASFPYTILATTTFTLTAFIKGVIVNQKQLTITVFTLMELARLQFTNKKLASDCISLILKHFPLASANDTAIAMAKAGYQLTEMTAALKIGFPKLTPEQVAEAISLAFGRTTPADLAILDKEKGLTSIEAGANLVSQFPGISAMDFGLSLAQAGYSTEQLGLALKQYFPKLSPVEVAGIFRQIHK
ncbi:hypothetical protein [Flavobacterium sp. RS13.1]|uniref:hypothetical protein n=1 Tax=Flavobacterium sp. RS13.1 TaxID=3400345 RepID=UPI003AAE44F8